MIHIPGRNKLTFLDVHCPPGLPCGHQQIRLPAKKRRDLQHVHSFCRNLAMARFVHIRQHRQPKVLGQSPQNSRAFHQPRSTKALHAGAIRFVIARFEDQRHPQVSRNPLNSLRHRAHVGFVLNHAWPRDQE